MKKIIIHKKELKENKKSKNWDLDQITNINKQINLVNMLYLNDYFKEKNDLEIELKKKLSSYKQQDKKKKRYDDNKFIKLDELLEKLIVCKLRCHYCKQQCLVFYKNVREKKMWTLDRIDNNIGHYTNNVVISCLECNLQKRRRGEEAFKFMKQMVIKKCE